MVFGCFESIAERLPLWVRHAAFRSRLGWPKIVVRWLHSRLAVGTFFFQGWPLEPSSSKVAPRNFWERKIWRSIGATQRFDRNAGGPKLWQVGWIRGLPSGLVALKSGRRPLPRRARALAGGLRLVTEGYRGKPPLPPTSGGSPRGHLRPTRAYVIYGVFCAWC